MSDHNNEHSDRCEHCYQFKEIDIGDTLAALGTRLADILERLIPKPKIQIGEINIMIRVKDDNPDVPVAITIGDGVDAEGSVVPGAEFKASPLVSDNESAVSLIDDGAGGQSAHFGSPNADGTPATANLTGTVVDAAGAFVANLPTVSVEVSHGAVVSLPNATVKLGDLTDS